MRLEHVRSHGRELPPGISRTGTPPFSPKNGLLTSNTLPPTLEFTSAIFCSSLDHCALVPLRVAFVRAALNRAATNSARPKVDSQPTPHQTRRVRCEKSAVY